MPVVSSTSSSEALKMSEIYSDCKISDSSGDRAEVNIVDADDGESDEIEFGEVGDDSVGDDIILSALFDNVRNWLGRLPLNVNAIAGGERGTAKGGAGETNMGWLFDPEPWTAFCALAARQNCCDEFWPTQPRKFPFQQTV